MKKFIAIAMLILLPIQAQAAVTYYSGNRLVELMREYDKFEVKDPNTSYDDVGAYQGYINGVSDTLAALNLVCVSMSVTGGQEAAIVSKYLKLNPEQWGNSAASLVFTALVNAFPCKK